MTMAWQPGDGKSAYLLLVLCLASHLGRCVVATSDATRPVVTIPQGVIEGINMRANNSREIYGFMGVPYAKPPIGDLRFKAPEPPTPWNGTFDASQDDKLCLQVVSGAIYGNEDCLHLNLYTPKLPSQSNTTLMPVMIFVVGGGFKSENNTHLRFGPDYFLTKDIVQVVPSYRVGILGSLSTGDEVAPGNFGMKDLVMSLQWIQDNIKYFGGDPTRVTLAGGSSGAMTVSWLALSNAANKGLFHQYITESGSALLPFLQQPNWSYVDRGHTVAKHFDCPTNSSKLMVECLRGFTGEELTDTDDLFSVWSTYPEQVWLPTMEPDIEGALMTKSPAKLMAEGKFSDLPWLVSNVRDEGIGYALPFDTNSTFLDEFLEDFDVAAPQRLGYALAYSNVTAYTERLKAYYLNDLTADRKTIVANISQMCGDVLFMHPTYVELKQRLANASSPTYYMSFDYRGVFSHTYYYSGGLTNYTDIAHGDEIIYIYRNLDGLYGSPSWSYSDNDWKIVQTMVTMWQNFIIGGGPTPADSDGNVLWPPYDSTENYLQVGNGPSTEIVMKHQLLKERMEFMDSLVNAIPLLKDE